MFSKRQPAVDTSALPPAKRLRATLQTHMMRNTLSSGDIQRLATDARAGGAVGVGDLRAGRTNTSRTLRRKFLKGTLWPKEYAAKVRAWNTRRHREETKEVSLLLPREVLLALGRHGALEVLLQKQGLDEGDRAHMQGVEAKLGSPAVAIGLWQDGVPTKWDRSASVEVLSMNLPGLDPDGPYGNLRIPLFSILKSLLSTNTWHDIFGIIQWSFMCLWRGFCPQERHDKTPFSHPSDKAQQSWADRRALEGSPLPARGALVQFRADWKAWKEVFSFPAWNEGSGCCWKCNVLPGEAIGPAQTRRGEGERGRIRQHRERGDGERGRAGGGGGGQGRVT